MSLASTPIATRGAREVRDQLKVAVIPCADYDRDRVEAAVRACVEPLGGMGAYVRPGQRVLIKPNLLTAVEPETAIVTHPAVVEAVVRLVGEAGGHAVIADSPGSSTPYAVTGLQRIYAGIGLLDVAERTGAELNLDISTVHVTHPQGVILREFNVIRPAVDADVVISIPKLKTHMLTALTGATKNMFGLLPGRDKPRYHGRFPLVRDFAEMLLDILSFARPALTIMDGITGLEGNGPGSHGVPRHVGVLLASPDSVALDAAACQLIGLNPRRVPMLALAQARGWWDGDPGHLDYLGANLDDHRVHDYRMPMITSTPISWAVAGYHTLSSPVLQTVFVPRPVPQKGKCTQCGICVRSCPRDAIAIADGVAQVDNGLCIECYTCHELCPEAAIDLRYSRVGRLVQRLRGRERK